MRAFAPLLLLLTVHGFAQNTSGLGYAAARLLAAEGYREVIVTGRRLAQIKETAAQLAAEAKRQIFTPLELDLNDPVNVHSAVAASALVSWQFGFREKR